MRTETMNYSRNRAAVQGAAYTDRFLNKQAVYTTWDGDRMVGTITSTVSDCGVYLIVTFADGRWARLDDRIELVKN